MIRRTGLIMGSAGAPALTLALSVPASAAGRSAEVQAGLKNLATGLCLESDGAGRMGMRGCTGSRSQTWVEGGNNSLGNSATGYCLESDGAGGSDNTYATTCNGSRYQSWIINGDRTIQNSASGWCLASDTFGRTFSTVCSGTTDQLWGAINARVG